jgi:DNA-binding MarR family transcriptional regulator
MKQLEKDDLVYSNTSKNNSSRIKHYRLTPKGAALAMFISRTSLVPEKYRKKSSLFYIMPLESPF